MPNIRISETHYEYDRAPDHCPLCHHGIQAIKVGSNLISRSDRQTGHTLQVLYRCPRDECQRAFIASYTQNRERLGHYPTGDYLLRNTAPFRPTEPDTPKELKELSPSYHEILEQSTAAEGFRLNQIAGCGFRKALEFLIKDYAIHKHPDDADAIKRKMLGACINEYVNDANVKVCASRAAWIGNDETHYIRKWGEKDINDLKTLLRLTSAWILNELLTEKYLREME
ncbi:hypothetical protein [Marinobacter sp.]|uniref:hypothetical protein n=1 Tax=Marinobacter sp. TaxID=50741 RepID=UPI003BAA123E